MKTFTGIVATTKMNKTVVVSISRIVTHPLYKKQLRKIKRIKAHNENLELKEGDRVKIVETRPISKDKHFRVSEVIK